MRFATISWGPTRQNFIGELMAPATVTEVSVQAGTVVPPSGLPSMYICLVSSHNCRKAGEDHKFRRQELAKENSQKKRAANTLKKADALINGRQQLSVGLVDLIKARMTGGSNALPSTTNTSPSPSPSINSSSSTTTTTSSSTTTTSINSNMPPSPTPTTSPFPVCIIYR